MRFSTIRHTLMGLIVASASIMQAQVTLLQENFDNCILPPNWQVQSTGNQDPTWYVSNSVTNDDASGQSMNGSCFLVIDDDAEGDGTPAYVLDFVSPVFDCSQHSTIELSMDIHYRDWNESNEIFSILVDDGTTQKVVKTYTAGNTTGDEFWEYENVKIDLAFFSNSSQTRLIIRYDDGGGFAWWAGVDNISVTGSGQANNIITETFNTCQKPTDWSTQVLTGNNDWVFGTATQGGNSMNGSCFAFFDDDLLGDSAAYSTVRLTTPWFDGSQYSQYELKFDLIHRYYKEIFTLYVEHGDGSLFTLREWATDEGGPGFDEFVAQTFDLSPYRNQQMRVVFQYYDGDDWGWWSGIDNVKISGSGTANDLCATATGLTTGAACVPGDNQNAVFDGPLPTCGGKATGSLWYKWQADFSGTAMFDSRAQFNDVVSVFTGTCATLQPITCNNYDEHGFQGEITRFNVQNGTNYLIRVSGQDEGFGKPKGLSCVSIASGTPAPNPPNQDLCANASLLSVGTPCANSTNRFATLNTPAPSHNELARADVWYYFNAPTVAANEYIELQSNADFSDIITVYSGSCNNLTEVATNHKGQTLKLPALTSGQTYRIQIAGTFATVEGTLCPQILKKTATAPANDACASATLITIGSACTTSSNFDATWSGIQPPCVPYASRDVWFRFVAPASGAVRLNTGADFEHVATLWSGACGSLEALQCLENPLRCQGFVTLGDLVPGQTYYIQVASMLTPGGESAGEVCIRITNINTAPDFEPLAYTAKAICIGVDQSQLVTAQAGGVAPYTFAGSQGGAVFNGNTPFITVITDAMGCEVAVTGTTPECTSGCFLNASISTTVSICGANLGALTANITTGTAPYTFSWSNGASTQSITGLAAGNYAVTITDAGGCSTTLTQQLTTGTPVSATVGSLTLPTSVTAFDGAITIVPSGGTGIYNYDWAVDYDPNLTFANSATITNLGEGTYTVTITDNAGCSTTQTVVIDVTGTDNLADTFGMILTPNPASEATVLTLKFPDFAAEGLQIALTHTDGRILRSWQTGATHQYEQTIPTTDLPSGVYFVQVRTATGVAVRRLVVAR
jgi:Secretion system C-terminal sorting domain/SprB repeat